MNRKLIIHLFSLLLSVVVLGFIVGNTFAQSYPNKRITFICGYPPGSGIDIITRIIGEQMSKDFGQPVVTDNRVGANGGIAARMTAGAAPDGYTIMLVSTSLAVNMSVTKVPYDLVKDFTPVALVGVTPYVIAVPSSLSANSMKDLVALAKSKPGQLNYASSGIGGTPHLMGEMLKIAGGVDIVHVAYKGTPEAISDLLGGRVQIWITTLPTALSHVKAGNIRVLGVGGPKRASEIPDAPTMAEAGFPTLDVVVWFAGVAPAKTSKGIVNQLRSEIEKILGMPAVRERLASQGVEPDRSSPTVEEISAFIKKDVERWGKVVKDTGIRVE